MIRAGQIAGVANVTKDHDLGAFGYSLWKDLPGGGGVVEGLAVTTNSVSVGRALVVGIRTSTTPNEKFLMHIELTTAETIDTSGTKKIWLEPIAARVNDPSLNTVADGSGLAQVATGADWPATAHIRLATVVSGVITDARVYTRTAAEAARDKAFNSGLATGTASAYVLELTPAPTAYATRMEVIFTAPAQNLSPVTINVNGLGAKTLKLPDGTTDVPAGMILNGQIVVLHYDGTNFRVTSAPYTGYNVASQAEAEAGVDNAKMMTPLRTAQAVDELRPFAAVADWLAATDPAKSVPASVGGVSLIAPTAYSSPVVVGQALTNRNHNSVTPTKYKEVVAPVDGTYRVTFSLASDNPGNNFQGRIYKNGAAFGTLRTVASTSMAAFSEDLAFVAGDLIQLYLNNAGSSGQTQSFYVQIYPVPKPLVGTVNLD